MQRAAEEGTSGSDPTAGSGDGIWDGETTRRPSEEDAPGADLTAGSSDGIRDLILLGGSYELLGLWLQAVADIMELQRRERVPAGDPPSEDEVVKVCRGLHRSIDLLREAGEVESVLRQDVHVASAPLVLGFLTQKIEQVPALQEALVKDLCVLLDVPVWRRTFDNGDFQKNFADRTRYLLANHFDSTSGENMSMGERRSRADYCGLPDINETHHQSARTIAQSALEEVGTSLVESGSRIVVLGDRGSGKSSCCNAAFGQDLAQTGMGRSVTSGITLHEATEGCPVNIYDTKGFESMSNEETFAQLKGLVEERKQAVSRFAIDDPKAISEQLHVIWWVVSVIDGGRFSAPWIQKVASLFTDDKVPIIIVLNKCDTDDAFVREVERQVQEDCFWAAGVVRVVANAKQGPMCYKCEKCGSEDISFRMKTMTYDCQEDDCESRRVPLKKCYGMDELIKTTAHQLPARVAGSFIAAQKVWLEGLDSAALRDICIFSIAAAGIGAAPIPALTRLVLYPVQVAMLFRLAAIYGIVLSTKAVAHIMMSLCFVGLAGLAGWGMATLLKLIPGANIVGMTTDALVSASSTLVMGLVVRDLLRRVRSRALCDSQQQALTPEDIAEIMSNESLRELYNSYSERLRASLVALFQNGVPTAEALQQTVQEAIDEVPAEVSVGQ